MKNKEYKLQFGWLGNGLTVWDRLQTVNNDYKTVAHISDNGEVKFYCEMSEEMKEEIKIYAEKWRLKTC